MRIKTAKGNEDIQAIADLADIIWHEHFPSILSEEQIDYMVEKFQSYEAIKSAIENDGYQYYMMYDGDDLCAYMGFHCEGNDVIFISKVYVRADKRRMGIATKLMEQLSKDYPKAEKWYLTVNKYNIGSIKMYEYYGFEIAKEQCADIGNGFVMDDYVMEKNF